MRNALTRQPTFLNLGSRRVVDRDSPLGLQLFSHNLAHQKLHPRTVPDTIHLCHFVLYAAGRD